MPGLVFKPSSTLQVIAEVFIQVFVSSNWEF